MIKNTTKDKGDLGLISVMKDLHLKGIKSCLPVSEHLPFDLIAVREDGELSRVSVKFKTLKNGRLDVPLKSVYSTSKGAVAKTIDFSLIDCIAIYCPDTDECYYIPVGKLKDNKAIFGIRMSQVERGTNNLAKDYQSVENIWKVL